MAQGVDLDYAGVILCKDIRYENGKVVFYPEEDADTDEFSGIKRIPKEKGDELIRNTYRVLLTRGIKGTYIYCEDKALREYIRNLSRN